MSAVEVGSVTLSIVVPVYNEERGLQETIERLRQLRETVRVSGGWVLDVELIVVDDASTDGTPDLVKTYPDVRLIRHETNKGYGGALKTGFEAAKGSIVGFLDADGTYPPEEFPRLCETLFREEADIVVGSRMVGAASKMPIQRYIGNRFFAYFLSWIVGRTVTDTSSGMRVFRKRALDSLMRLPDGLHFTPAMSTRALHEGLRVVEIPIPYSERVGQSKLNPVADGFRFLNVIVGIARLYNPLKFFAAAGLFLLTLACLLAFDPVSYYLRFRRVEDTEIYRLFTIMVLGVTGTNLITFGAFANCVLEIIRAQPHTPNGWLGQYLSSRRLIRRSGILGAVSMVMAVVLNYQTVLEYVTTDHIYVHWVYILTGATVRARGVGPENAVATRGKSSSCFGN
jgi:glycosyltransferase involved in cell wall biosynthesis